ncbi:protoporphyrinogen oxidase [Salinisphaera sp. Q1T1-3]|uniref:protoporphyrinogen oxidase n=1 Tax=Salinisphaera sp. Q1T1-3 TaxID=2321229 RepID=UPI000E71BD2E|nr:protoporphyrinogen oxidase [Salinisphaera sp. Q1T1-3]RJS93252.1 protoporphyrinogen oxidase [Salinisphaera sp. Q1T1-3]
MMTSGRARTDPVQDVVIVGGGATGLAAAHALAREQARVTLLEAQPQVGGNLRTLRDGPWQIEQGPNTVIMKPPLYALLAELDLLDEARVADPASRKRFVALAGRPVALPSNIANAVTNPLLGWRGWSGILREPFVRRSTAADESLADFVQRRLGRRVLDRLVDPFVSGVYAGDPARLLARAAMPRLVALEQAYGSLIRGGLMRLLPGRAKSTPAVPRAWRGRLLSFDGGLQRLAERLQSAITAQRHADIVCECRIERIERTSDGIWQLTDATGRRWAARRLVLSVPAHVAASLLAPIDTTLAEALSEIVYPPVSIVALGFRQADIAHPLDGFGLLLPRAEGRETLGTLFPSSLFPGRAPPGHHLLNVFLGGRQSPDTARGDDAQQVARATTDLRDLLGIAGPPVWQRVVRWPQAIPQYEIGHLERLARIDAALTAHEGLSLAGNWRDGIAVGDCLENGRQLGEALAAAMRSRGRAP